MAKTNKARTTAPSFYEVAVNGSPKAVRGLLAGMALGLGIEDYSWYHKDHDIADPDRDGHVRRAAEKLHLLPVAEVRVVVTAELARLLRQYQKRIATSGLCTIESITRIKQARAKVKYHSYARRYDEEVMVLLKDLPRGIKLENVERKVETDPKAKGIEAYAPVHDFESCGCGDIVGRFDLVLQLRDRLDVHPLIECEAIELVLA